MGSLKASEFNESLCLVNIVNVINQGKAQSQNCRDHYFHRALLLCFGLFFICLGVFLLLDRYHHILQLQLLENIMNNSENNRITYRNIKHP